MDIYSIVRGEGDSGGEADSLLRFDEEHRFLARQR